MRNRKSKEMKYSVFLEDVPSVNSMYFHLRPGVKIPGQKLKEFSGYWKDKSKTKWIEGRAGKAFREAGWPKFSAEKKWTLELVAYWPTARRADMDNNHKAIKDALVHAGHFEDDNNILIWDKDYFHPGDIGRGDVAKGIQGFMLTLYEKQ